MRDRIAAGVGIGVWGLGVGVFTTAWVSSPWPVVAVVLAWAVYYALRPLTANAALVQYATVLAAVLLGMAIGLLRNSDAAGLAVWQVLLFALLFGTLCFVAWMAPVGLIASFLRGGRTTARPHDPV